MTVGKDTNKNGTFYTGVLLVLHLDMVALAFQYKLVSYSVAC